MSIFVIKIIAIVTMFVDHFKYCIPGFSNTITVIIGRMSFPLFAFAISEGYVHTHDLKKYFIRLIIVAFLSQAPFMLFRSMLGEWKMLNIIFTLLLGLLSILVFDKIKKKYISIPICALIIWIGYLIKADYGWYGVSLVLLFYLGRKDKMLLSILYFSLMVIYFWSRKIVIIENLWYFGAHLIPLIIVLLYNGKKGKDLKLLFYSFYPVHMLILYLIFSK